MNRRHVLVSLAAAPLAITATVTRAQAWPQRPIRILVPFPAGGSADLSARLIADHLRTALGQPTVVENRTGAGGNLAAGEAARAEPDGHTLFVGTNGTQAINQSLYRQLPFDPERDFMPLAMIWEAPNLVVVRNGLPVENLRELIDFMKANPDRLNYGSSGIGSATHLAGALFENLAGGQVTHVPFRGQGPAITELVAGRIDLMFPLVPDILSQIQAGTVRVLAVAARRRSTILQSVPTAAEAGLPDLVSSAWMGMLVPRGVPAEIARRLEGEFRQLTAQPAFVTRMREIGIEVQPLFGDAFAAKIAEDRALWSQLIRTKNISAE